jgi:Spy/CpxP family protein refolding chaperone
MKKLSAIVIAFSFFALNANAQVKRNVTPSQKIQRDSTRKKMNGKMMKDLNLSPSQQAQMKEFHQNMKQKMDAIKNDASLTPEQKKAKMKELHQTQRQTMNSILTPEQKEKMKAQRKEWREKNKGKNWNGKKTANSSNAPNEKSATQ